VLEQNSIHTVDFTDMTHDAMGVAKIDGFPIFVKNAMKGEKARIRITKVNKNFAFGHLDKIIQESPFRKAPICEHYYECGGCNIMHMNYEMQLGFKRHRVKETLKRIGGIDIEVANTVGMNNPYYYRNKAMVPFGMANGKIVAGFYKPKSHEIVDIRRCHIFPKYYSDIVRHLKILFQQYKISVYDEEKQEGLVRGAMIRSSEKKGETMVVIVTENGKIPAKNEIIEDLVERFPTIKSVILNIAQDKGTFRLGRKSKVLYGEDLLHEELLGLEFRVSHASFFQVNPEQTETLYKKAIEYADLKKNDVVVDAYCGIGAIGLAAAGSVDTVIGFDVSKSAIKNAAKNAEVNHITNAQFINGKAEDVLPKLNHKKIDAIFIDPPRKGCDKSFLQTVVATNIKTIIYISCNVSTFSRDMSILASKGYKLEKITPFDMFPQTSHIETVAKITKI